MDGSSSERSRMAARFGRMVRRNNDLLYEMRPADTHVAVFDSFDAAIYLHRRSRFEPMFDWFVRNQYGFFRALRQVGMGCDFIDERGLRSPALKRYSCIYVPFSMCMTEDIARTLRDYVAQGGTIIADCLTAFTTPGHSVYREQPGAGLAEVLGVQAAAFEVAYSGSNADPRDAMFLCRYFSNDKKESPLVASRLVQPVQPMENTKVLYRDDHGRPVVTVNDVGKGHALWTGTLLGLSCRDASTPPVRSEAVADLVRPYVPKVPWKLDTPAHTVICRRLSSNRGDLFVLFNESRSHKAEFKLNFGHAAKPAELLFPETPGWQKASDSSISGSLGPMQGAVVFCPLPDDK
jgi:beta-galactosidase